MTSAPCIYTTGYEGFDADTFLWKLRTEGIEVVADVRNSAVSRNHAFTQAKLRPFLQSNGIEYVHFSGLGAPAELRRLVRADGDLNAYFAAYREHLAHCEADLAALYNLVRERVCCLLCLERNPQECHRIVLAEVLSHWKAEALEVRHR